MRVFIITFIIFSIIITGGIWLNIFINNSVNSFAENIDLISYAVQTKNPPLLYEHINKANNEWQALRYKLCFFIKHEYIFEIDNAIGELYAFSSDFDSAEATLSVSKMRAGTDCIIETSAFTLKNII